MLKKPGTRLFIGMLIAMLAGACMMADDEPQPPPKPDGTVSVEAKLPPLPDEPPVRAPDPDPKELPPRN